MNAIAKVMLKRLSRAARPYLRSSGLLQVSGVYNRSAMVWEPGNETVVVLAPHMDDEVIGCGGSLALHVQRGAKVCVVFMTDGRGGSSDISVLQGDERARRERELIEIRKAEAREALKQLGITDMVCLDAPDGALGTCSWVAAKLREVLDSRQPELLYLPFYLEEHPDHRATSRVLMDAAEGSAWNFQCLGYEVWTPLFPNCLVRIDQTIEIKKAALACYRSQLAQADYLHASIGLNAHRSAGLLDARNGYAEAFHSLALTDYREQFAQFCRSV
ncbi:MAG: PIG-L deacetylase family protein [Povalibacter sp.]